MSELSTFLFARPSFVEGTSRLLDFGDTLTEYNRSLTGEQADYLALLADWRQIGQDIESASASVARAGGVKKLKAK
ncbi:hypothetical protein AYO44_03875 [Planctomycetaceae bacterium SCGC AG-212-F19]|nr:hypothetical protein AYO44_03875 [Planctomycetaceae bacterium SCGC AG-212-F19]